MVLAEGRKGPIRLVLRGKLPKEMKLFASEIHPDPNEHNASWIFEQAPQSNQGLPRAINFKMSERKSALQQAAQNKKNLNSDLHKQPFIHLYIKFESPQDCQFSTIVTFPEEEDHQRRRRMAEQSKESLLARDMRPNEELKAHQTSKGKLVAATQFKKRVHREIKEMVDDSEAAEEFLRSIAIKRK